jgi:UDP-3-O-[3-hydroxymyristoyl] glucosamine N-acyltransferase
MISFGQLPSSQLSDLIPGASVTGKHSIIASLGLPSSTFAIPLLVFAETVGQLRLALENGSVGGVITTEDVYRGCPFDLGSRFAVFVDNPRETFWELHLTLIQETTFYNNPSHRTKRIVGKSSVSRSAIVHDGVVIGDNCIIGDHVVLLPGTTIGNEVVLQPGVVIGSTGFECKLLKGHRIVIPHAGGVQIGNRVEIGALCAIDKHVFASDTVIAEETKLDNLIHVAHACRVGRRCMLAASVTLGGSTVIHDDVWIGPGASISDNLTIGRGARISLGAVVVRDVQPGRTVTGNLAIPHDQFLRALRRALSQGPSNV